MYCLIILLNNSIFPVEKLMFSQDILGEILAHLIPLIGMHNLKPPIDVSSEVLIYAEYYVQNPGADPCTGDDIEGIESKSGDLLRFEKQGLACTQFLIGRF